MSRRDRERRSRHEFERALDDDRNDWDVVLNGIKEGAQLERAHFAVVRPRAFGKEEHGAAVFDRLRDRLFQQL